MNRRDFFRKTAGAALAPAVAAGVVKAEDKPKEPDSSKSHSFGVLYIALKGTDNGELEVVDQPSLDTFIYAEDGKTIAGKSKWIKEWKSAEVLT